jgi:tRNA modification GTPase
VQGVDPWLAISCASGAGIEALQDALAAAVDGYVGGLGQEAAFVTTARQAHALESAQAELRQLAAADAGGAGDELLAFELQQAVRALRDVVGDVSSDDILDKVFHDFCLGK